jgi:hypothetical protein
MEAILETGLACLAPPLAVLIVSLGGIAFLFLLDRKATKG